MSLTKAQKEELVKQLTEQIKASKSVVFADFKGLPVAEMVNFRHQLRKEGVQFKVAKRTLFKIAAKEAGFGEISDEALEGSVGAAFSMEDEMSAPKLVYKFAKTNENVKLRGGLFEGKVLSVEEAKQLATMPGKDELIGKFMYLIKYPVQGFHDVLQNTVGGFVRALNAIKEKQEKAA